ncbi:DNA translocase FtsK [Methylobacterium sp. Leaf118]|uniref:DNA translocase FtsK n=1 Tax=Methylobacterium sp. Leaf118 TaxID=2876562 RepID=UPI001E3CD670|nr:DNA translocase FtsK [Methylobacterium sp. Leaf118]
MNLRANLARRIAGAPPAPPRALPRTLPHPALPSSFDAASAGPEGFEAGAMPSWLVPPGAMLGRPGPGLPAAPAWAAQETPLAHLSQETRLTQETRLAQETQLAQESQAAQDPEEGLFEMPVPARPSASQPLYGEPAFESRIDARASSPGLLVRTPRRPAAIAPEAPSHFAQALPYALPYASSSQGATQAAAEAAVRFTRTPDPVLIERRRRALEAEREAQARAQALLDAQIAAQAAAEAAALEAERARIAAVEAAAREASEASARAEESARALAAPEVEALPSWRRPFVPPPGVRFFRSPDRRPKPVSEPVSEPVTDAVRDAAPAPVESAASIFAEAVPFIPPVPAEPSDWSDVPDWSSLHGWFGHGESQPVEALPTEMLPVETQLVETQLVEAPGVEARIVGPADPAPVAEAPAAQLAPVAARPAFAPAPRRTVHAMAARAAIFPAHPSEIWSAQLFEPFDALAVPASVPAASSPMPAPSPAPLAGVPQGWSAQISGPEVFSSQVLSSQAEARLAAAPSTAQPLTIPARPVLLRSKAAPSSEEIEAAETVFAMPVAEAVPEPVYAEPVAVPVAESENRPRAILPERPALIPAGRHLEMTFVGNADYELPSLELLAEPPLPDGEEVDADELEQNALNLQQTVQDFGVRGDILAVRPGPVVTLYELEPAPGTKSSRVIGLSDDIARSMSAVSARVAVVPGRNVIGIELPNPVRETVYLRELLASVDFVETKHKLALCLGKNIGGEPIIADLARMPHLLVAGTTGSGKSVAINTMILSLLYRLKPEECRLIMVDPKMLELSVYDGIPHLLSPVVIDPKKAVIALKWAVREMEERYKKMSKISVRNIDGYNARMKEARERGETITRTVQTGFDRTTGEAVFEEQAMDLSALPFIVIVVDEMADLMMVAGKDIEGAIQRLAQMARAAGIHLIMATQRPSVDVITGTIKANFPTRISFQVTSKIDSRTILGEMGAEQLLGQGDMLFMAGGGRTTRVHGPFCSDSEVETVVAHLKRQGRPSYLEAVTADDGSSEPPEKPAKGAKAAAKAEKDDFAEVEEADAPVFDIGAFAAVAGAEGGELYEQAIAVVLRDRKASTSYIQRRLQIGYNRAASIMERMEIEGIVGPANHAGKREILVEGLAGAPAGGYDDE